MYISVSFNRSFFPLPPLSRPSNTVNSSLNPHDARPSSQRLLISTNFSPFLRRKFPKCRFILQIFQRYSFPRKRKHPNPWREKNLLPTINLSRSEIQSLPSCTPFLKFPSLRHAFSPRFLTIVRDFSASSRVSRTLPVFRLQASIISCRAPVSGLDIVNTSRSSIHGQPLHHCSTHRGRSFPFSLVLS